MNSDETHTAPQIECPHCHQTFDLGDGVLSHLRKALADEHQATVAGAQKELRDKELALKARAEELSALESKIEKQVEGRLAEKLSEAAERSPTGGR